MTTAAAAASTSKEIRETTLRPIPARRAISATNEAAAVPLLRPPPLPHTALSAVNPEKGLSEGCSGPEPGRSRAATQRRALIHLLPIRSGVARERGLDG